MLTFESFRFIKHARERRERREEAARQHQLALFERLAGMIESISDSQSRQMADVSQALVEIAKSNQAQAEGFSTWLKSFQLAAEPPTSSVIREADEIRAEEARILEEFGIDPTGVEVPEEFKLALQLRAQGISDLANTPPV